MSLWFFLGVSWMSNHSSSHHWRLKQIGGAKFTLPTNSHPLGAIKDQLKQKIEDHAVRCTPAGPPALQDHPAPLLLLQDPSTCRWKQPRTPCPRGRGEKQPRTPFPWMGDTSPPHYWLRTTIKTTHTHLQPHTAHRHRATAPSQHPNPQTWPKFHQTQAQAPQDHHKHSGTNPHSLAPPKPIETHLKPTAFTAYALLLPAPSLTLLPLPGLIINFGSGVTQWQTHGLCP